MSNIQNYACFIEQHFHPQIVIPELAGQIGLDESILLQQIHYWLKKSGKPIDGAIWIYNTYEQWKEQFCYWSISKIKRIVYSLEKTGLITSKKMNVHKSNHTKWYTINYAKLCELIAKIKPLKKEKKKKFASFQSELSSSQTDTIINTDTNYTNNIYLSNEENARVETSLTEKVNLHNKTNKHFFYLEKEEKVVCQRMVEIWHEVFTSSKNKIILTPQRENKLYKIWNKFCNQDIAKWEKICLAVNSSKFLMGEKDANFKAYFDWVISEKTVPRILAGEFNVGDRVPDVKQAEIQAKAKQERDAYIAKMEAERVEKAKKEKQLNLEKVAQQLAEEELKKLESSWSESDKEKAMEDFKIFLSNGGGGDHFFAHLSENFQKNNRFTYQPVAVNFFFNEFKIRTYLKPWKEFMEEAELDLKLKLKLKENSDFISTTHKPEMKQDQNTYALKNGLKFEVKNKTRDDESNQKDNLIDLEIEAQRLAYEELEGIEANWCEADKENALAEFADFLLGEGNGDPVFKFISQNFRKKGWVAGHPTVVESCFKEFKIIKYLKKSWEDFRKQAESYYNNNLGHTSRVRQG